MNLLGDRLLFSYIIFPVAYAKMLLSAAQHSKKKIILFYPSNTLSNFS